MAKADEKQPLGVIGSGTRSQISRLLPLFIDQLTQAGFIDGRNVDFKFRWADGDYDRIEALARELVALKVKAIFAIGDSAWAVKSVTSSIPIVFANGSDPVETGLVPSLNEPAGNVTGFSWTSNPLAPKRMELLRELIPSILLIAALANPNNPNVETETHALKAAAAKIGLGFALYQATDMELIKEAFGAMLRDRVRALVIAADSFFTGHARDIVALEAQYGIPTGHSVRQYAQIGGLISYSPRRDEAFRGAGRYMARVLAGTKPADLPVQLPTTFELVINLKTAKTLNLIVPPSILARADEIIE